MTAGLLMNLALGDTQEISTTPELCKRVRFRQSDCQYCMDICPEHAIELELGPSINDSCTQCGLCVNVCPTEVFHNARSPDVYLLDQIHSLKNDSSMTGKKKRIYIHCQAAEKPHKDSHQVTCLGNLTENVMLGAGLSGLDEMVLIKGACAQCHLTQGEALLCNAMETFNSLQQQIDLSEFRIRLEDKQKDNSRSDKLNRRAFFSRVVENVNERAGPDIHPIETPVLRQRDNTHTAQQATRPSTRRSLLRELLTEQALLKQNGALKKSMPWDIMQVDEENCIGCGICVAVCPTGALIKEYEENQLVRTYNSALCTNCDLCQEACPQQVIGFTEARNLQEIVEDNPRVVARINLNACMICGEIIPVKEGKICTTCEKRQISPVFM